MINKHRKRSAIAKKLAMVGAAAATASALTVGVVQVPDIDTPANAVVNRDVALTAGPNYIQIISDSSSTMNNLLFIRGDLGSGAANIWNTVANAIPGGLLPTFTEGTEQEDLTSIQGLFAALSVFRDPVPDLGGVPGLPADADVVTLVGLAPGLLVTVVPLLVPLGQAGAALVVLQTTIDSLDGINDGFLAGIPVTPPAPPFTITGIPSLTDLIPGFTVTKTTLESGYDWPLLGLGPLLGLSGSTTVGNTFAQLPGMTPADLAAGFDELVLPDLPTNALDRTLGALVAAATSPLNLLSDIPPTPSVTAWVPTGEGNYGLPLGGSFGWFATMPTLAVGPVTVDDLPVSTTDTVISIPLLAGGVNLPLNLASLGFVTTPGVVFPTATGISTFGGTTVTSWSIPLLNLSYTSANIPLIGGSSIYVGTNGINYHSGTKVGALTTPFGVLPIVYSVGALNAGSTGFGFTGPSLFTIGLGPSTQVGTAPTQQSPDGFLPPDLLNTGLTIPTQTNDVSTILGLPNLGGALISTVVTPLFNALVAPIGARITNRLDQSIGPVADGIASFNERVTSAVADLLNAGPSAAATQSVVPFAAGARSVESPTVLNRVKPKIGLRSPGLDLASARGTTQVKNKLNLREGTGGLEAATAKARGRLAQRFSTAKSKLDTIAEDGRQQIDRTLKDAGRRVETAVDNARGGPGPGRHVNAAVTVAKSK